jgi:hypothetical protein
MIHQKREVMAQVRIDYPIAIICHVLGLARSTAYGSPAQ